MSHPLIAPSLEPIWAALEAELDRWRNARQRACFWWRDDDAAKVNEALERLLALQTGTRIPLVVAVVPALAEPALAIRLEKTGGVIAAQHGFQHLNHATSDEKKSEFPASRPLEIRLSDLEEGQKAMARLFPETKRRPLLVPPWNRLGADLFEHLARCGYAAVSTFQLRQQYWAAPGLPQLNTHIDPVGWRTGDTLAACRQALIRTRQFLEQMRLHQAPLQPLGLLTHHLHHDEAGWDFVTEFLTRIAAHPAAEWLDFDTALEIGRPKAAVMATS